MKSHNEFRMFHKFLNNQENNGRTRPLYSNVQYVSRCTIFAEVWNQEIAEVWNPEAAGIWNHEPTKLWNHRPSELCVQIP
jgi:hypothetical protein